MAEKNVVVFFHAFLHFRVRTVLYACVLRSSAFMLEHPIIIAYHTNNYGVYQSSNFLSTFCFLVNSSAFLSLTSPPARGIEVQA